jgi:hypothetical protein
MNPDLRRDLDAENARRRACAEADRVAVAHLCAYAAETDAPVRVLIARRPDVDPPEWTGRNLLAGEGRYGTLDRLFPTRGDGDEGAWVVDLSPPPIPVCLGNGVASLRVSPRHLLPVRVRREFVPAP